MAPEPTQRARPELWVIATWALLAFELAVAIYLGMKRPGVGPVRVYVMAPELLALGALALGAVGAVWSAWSRPFLRPQRVTAFCLLAFIVATATYPLPFPSYRSSRPSAAKIRMPVHDEWVVAWGGEGELNAMMRTRPDRCFGFVLVRAVDGLTRAKPDDPLSAYAFDREVVAPCDAKVVRVVDQFDDTGAGATDLGNHVVLEIAPEEFLFLAGLERGSISVQPNQQVALGTPLARVGFSARSLLAPEPHLSIHLQSTPDPLEGQGIPFYFHDVRIDGEELQRGVPMGRGLFVGHPVTGQRIAAAM